MTWRPDVPWLEYDEIRRRADVFLRRANAHEIIPVNIELIIEQMAIDIVPLPGLRENFDTDGWLTPDETTIYIDEWEADHRTNRARFTLAHEVGHRELHSSLLREVRTVIQTISEWQAFVGNLPDDVRSQFEFQANCFAGLVLVPGNHLSAAYDRVLPAVMKLVRKSLRKGASKPLVLDFALRALAERLAPSFEVSSEVMLIRLEKERLSIPQT